MSKTKSLNSEYIRYEVWVKDDALWFCQKDAATIEDCIEWIKKTSMPYKKYYLTKILYTRGLINVIAKDNVDEFTKKEVLNEAD